MTKRLALKHEKLGAYMKSANKAPPHLSLQRSYHCSAPKNRTNYSRAPSRALASFRNKKSRLWMRSEMTRQKRKINGLSCVNRKTSHKKGNGDHMRMGVVKICLTGNLRPEKKLLQENSGKKNLEQILRRNVWCQNTFKDSSIRGDNFCVAPS